VRPKAGIARREEFTTEVAEAAEVSIQTTGGVGSTMGRIFPCRDAP